MQLKKWMAVGLLALGTAGAAGAALAASDGAPRGERHVVKHRMHGAAGGHPSVEFTAMHNIMAELLSARTGKTAAEIQALFDKGGPHEAFEALGLSKEEVRPMFQEARTQFITRAAAAGLITAQQAEKLKTAKVHVRHKRRMADEDDED